MICILLGTLLIFLLFCVLKSKKFPSCRSLNFISLFWCQNFIIFYSTSTCERLLFQIFRASADLSYWIAAYKVKIHRIIFSSSLLKCTKLKVLRVILFFSQVKCKIYWNNYYVYSIVRYSNCRPAWRLWGTAMNVAF